eukprot:9113635-Pyramimonas_sp.AAC.1
MFYKGRIHIAKSAQASAKGDRNNVSPKRGPCSFSACAACLQLTRANDMAIEHVLGARADIMCEL